MLSIKTVSFPLIDAKIAKDTNAIDETPQASPFSPSIKLIALTTPNTANTVKGIPHNPR